jgi:ribosomal protein S24E
LELELTSVKKNPLFNRQEIEFKVTQKKTPSRSNVRIGVAVALKVDLNQVYVREIETKSGTHLTLGTAHVYNDPTEALKVEPKYIIERNQKAKPEQEPAQETESELNNEKEGEEEE